MEIDRAADKPGCGPAENLWRKLELDDLEVRIALMLQAGCSNAEISRRLEITEEVAAHSAARILAVLCAHRNRQRE